MDTKQVVLTAVVGLVASLVTAVVTHLLTRAQERRKHEREVTAKLADLKSTERAQTMVMAVQYGHSCFVVERPGRDEKDRVFLPMGSRITLGSRNGIEVNERIVTQPRKLATGDVVTVPGAAFRITFVRLVS